MEQINLFQCHLRFYIPVKHGLPY